MSKLLIITASNGKNLKLAKSLENLAKEMSVEVELLSLVDQGLPLYHTDEEKKGIPKNAEVLANKFAAARAFIFIAPEYNGSVPPVFNNSLAWISRSTENWRESFNGKIAAVATHSGGGGLHGLMAMRQQLAYIGVNVLGRQIHTHYSKELNPESAKAVITELAALTNAE